jgi:DNA (cytosine-5)-methyltransferase 1
VISVREAARLHSFPDWFRFHWTKWHGFRQVGNSLPPLMGRAVASEITKALGRSVGKPQERVALGEEELLVFNMTEAANHFGVPIVDVPHPRAQDAARPEDKAAIAGPAERLRRRRRCAHRRRRGRLGGHRRRARGLEPVLRLAGCDRAAVREGRRNG